MGSYRCFPDSEIDNTVFPDHPAKEHSQTFTGGCTGQYRNTFDTRKDILYLRNRIGVPTGSQCIFQRFMFFIDTFQPLAQLPEMGVGVETVKSIPFARFHRISRQVFITFLHDPAVRTDAHHRMQFVCLPQDQFPSSVRDPGGEKSGYFYVFFSVYRCGNCTGSSGIKVSTLYSFAQRRSFSFICSSICYFFFRKY